MKKLWATKNAAIGISFQNGSKIIWKIELDISGESRNFSKGSWIKKNWFRSTKLIFQAPKPNTTKYPILIFSATTPSCREIVSKDISQGSQGVEQQHETFQQQDLFFKMKALFQRQKINWNPAP